MSLSTERKSFRRIGYCILENGLTGDELEGLRVAADELLAEPPVDGGGRFHDIGKGDDRRFLRQRHADYPAVADFLFSDRMKATATALLDASPFLFNEQFVVKGPKSGATFEWHQDGAYVGFEHQPYLTFWIALDDVNEDNSCLYVLPRNLDEDSSLVPHYWDKDGKQQIGYDGDDSGIRVTGPAGMIVVFSSTTLHRSNANTTGSPRRAYICQYSGEPIIDPATSQPKHFATAL